MTVQDADAVIGEALGNYHAEDDSDVSRREDNDSEHNSNVNGDENQKEQENQ